MSFLFFNPLRFMLSCYAQIILLSLYLIQNNKQFSLVIVNASNVRNFSPEYTNILKRTLKTEENENSSHNFKNLKLENIPADSSFSTILKVFVYSTKYAYFALHAKNSIYSNRAQQSKFSVVRNCGIDEIENASYRLDNENTKEKYHYKFAVYAENAIFSVIANETVYTPVALKSTHCFQKADLLKNNMFIHYIAKYKLLCSFTSKDLLNNKLYMTYLSPFKINIVFPAYSINPPVKLKVTNKVPELLSLEKNDKPNYSYLSSVDNPYIISVNIIDSLPKYENDHVIVNKAFYENSDYSSDSNIALKHISDESNGKSSSSSSDYETIPNYMKQFFHDTNIMTEIMNPMNEFYKEKLSEFSFKEEKFSYHCKIDPSDFYSHINVIFNTEAKNIMYLYTTVHNLAKMNFRVEDLVIIFKMKFALTVIQYEKDKNYFNDWIKNKKTAILKDFEDYHMNICKKQEKIRQLILLAYEKCTKPTDKLYEINFKENFLKQILKFMVNICSYHIEYMIRTAETDVQYQYAILILLDSIIPLESFNKYKKSLLEMVINIQDSSNFISLFTNHEIQFIQRNCFYWYSPYYFIKFISFRFYSELKINKYYFDKIMLNGIRN